jgi:hypothetical protein
MEELYGYDKELSELNNAKYKKNQRFEDEIRAWLGRILQEPLPDDFSSAFEDGTVLCRLLKQIDANLIKSYNSLAPFFAILNFYAMTLRSGAHNAATESRQHQNLQQCAFCRRNGSQGSFS